MGHQRLSSGTRSYAPAQRLAGGAHWGQISLPLVLFSLHALLRLMRSGLVGELVDCISHPPRHERRPDGSVDADDDGACCRKAYGAPHGLRGCANPQYASWRWLFLVNLPVGVLAIVLAVLFLPNDREETRQRNLDLVGFALL